MTKAKRDFNRFLDPSSWICKGTPDRPHPEIENWGDRCVFRGCTKTRFSTPQFTNRIPNDNGRKLIGILGITLFSIASIRSGIYLWEQGQTEQTCPQGRQQFEGTCVTLTDTSYKPNSQQAIETSKLLVKDRANSSIIAFNPEWVSNNDRVLFKGNGDRYRDLGLEAFANGDFLDAVKYFEKAVFSNRNDPEVQIYLNNAQAILQSYPLTIAVVVPVDNRETSAKEMLRGIADAQTRFNNSGGVGRRLVRIMIANDGNDPERARSIARHLGEDPEVLGVIGHNSSSASQAALSEYERAGLVTISPTSSSTSLKSDYFFRTVPSDAASGKKLAQYSQKLGLKKVAIFYNPSSSYSKSLKQAFESNLKQLGVNVLGSIDLTNPDLDLEEQLKIVKQEVDAIALFPDTETTSVAVALARINTELSGKPLPMLGGDALYSSQTLNDGGSAVNGLILAVPWFAGVQPYAKQAEQRWLGTVNWRTAASFDATQALLNALETDSTRSSVLQNLNSIDLAAKDTSGKKLTFADGNRREQPVLVKIVSSAKGQPQNFNYRFELIQP
jgi:branched-chain amino acid transport system substrate-binding protein